MIPKHILFTIYVASWFVRWKGKRLKNLSHNTLFLGQHKNTQSSSKWQSCNQEQKKVDDRRTWGEKVERNLCARYLIYDIGEVFYFNAESNRMEKRWREQCRWEIGLQETRNLDGEENDTKGWGLTWCEQVYER